MAEYGVTAEGFIAKTRDTILEERKAAYRSAFGQSLELGDYTPDGQILNITAEAEAELWELAEACYNNFDRDAVVGLAQDKLYALAGDIREEATYSTVVLTATGTPGTTITEGSEVSVDSTDDRFTVDEDTDIGTLTAWASATAYVLGDRVTNGGDAWECSVAGTSAGSGGPDSTGLEQGDTDVDNTVTWVYIGTGTGAVDVNATATVTGPINALAGDITTIETPIAGWSDVYNLTDATPGRDIETDEEYRLSSEQQLAAPGTAPKDAIRADLLEVDDVTAVRVFSNRTDTTDADGVPPRSVECLVQGGTDQDIFDQVFASVADGIGFHGTESGTVTDSEGQDHTVKFSRPTVVNIYVDVTLKKDPDTYEGDDAVKAAIVAAGNTNITGLDAVASRIAASVFNVTGVLDVTPVYIDTSASPSTSTTIAISLRQLADYDTSRITVTSSDATP